MSSRSITITSGTKGLQLDAPETVNLLPLGEPLDPAAALSATAQQDLLRAALAPLTELAKGRRRVAVVVGDLSLPAPYELILPALVKALVNVEIRPSRIGFLVYPGTGAPILGRGAIHRYGEEIVGDHELRPWLWEEGWPAPSDPGFAAADLRIAVRPRLARAPELPLAPFDFVLELELGRKLSMDIVSARAGRSAPEKQARTAPESHVYLAGGGGGEWESTLEEALLSLHEPANAKTVVLGFNGEEGLGSARFSNDLWNLIAEANEVLGSSGALPAPQSAPEFFDPAGTIADALSRYERTVLFSPAFAQHEEGEDLAERLRGAPHTGARLKLAGSATTLWHILQETHGPSYNLYVEPLGWRSRAVARG